MAPPWGIQVWHCRRALAQVSRGRRPLMAFASLPPNAARCPHDALLSLSIFDRWIAWYFFVWPHALLVPMQKVAIPELSQAVHSDWVKPLVVRLHANKGLVQMVLAVVSRSF